MIDLRDIDLNRLIADTVAELVAEGQHLSRIGSVKPDPDGHVRIYVLGPGGWYSVICSAEHIEAYRLSDSWTSLPTGASQITLRVGPADRQAIEEAIAVRRQWAMPDRGHDDETDAGATLAEICRGWMEFLDAQ